MGRFGGMSLRVVDSLARGYFVSLLLGLLSSCEGLLRDEESLFLVVGTS